MAANPKPSIRTDGDDVFGQGGLRERADRAGGLRVADQRRCRFDRFYAVGIDAKEAGRAHVRPVQQESEQSAQGRITWLGHLRPFRRKNTGFGHELNLK